MQDVPVMVEEHIAGKLPLAQYVTHKFDGLASTLEAIEAMHSGEVLRAVVRY